MMFHAVGLNAMEKSEMYKDVAEVSTTEENASIPSRERKRAVRRISRPPSHVFPTMHLAKFS